MRKLILVAVAMWFVSGCVTQPMRESPRIAASRHVLVKPYIPQMNESGLFHLSCTDRYPDGHSAYEAFDNDKAKIGRIELAKRHFIHAAMANNAYLDPTNKPLFLLPGWTLLDSLESDTGLALQVYGDAANPAGSKHIVVAYRGTNFKSSKDWYNNFALRDPPQYRQAYVHMKALRANYPSAQITATGHSLGGGIAMNMSMRVKGVDAVAFNMSPRVRFGDTAPYQAYRASLFEVGEILTGITKFYAADLLPASVHYGNYNFLDYRFFTISPVPEHGIYEIARALALVAMTHGDAEAKEFFRANIGEKQARDIDWEHCQSVFE